MADGNKIFSPSAEYEDADMYSLDELKNRALCPMPNERHVDLAAAFEEHYATVKSEDEKHTKELTNKILSLTKPQLP